MTRKSIKRPESEETPIARTLFQKLVLKKQAKMIQYPKKFANTKEQRNFTNFCRLMKFKHQKYYIMALYQQELQNMDNNSTMQGGTQDSRPHINGSVGSPNDRTVTLSPSLEKESLEIKDDDEALITLKDIGFDDFQIKDLNMDIMNHIEEALDQD